MHQTWTDDRPAAELAELEMFAEMLANALLTRYDGELRPVHRIVIGRLLRGESAAALLAALDAVREVAGRGESRAVALEAFVWALTREDEQVSADERPTASDVDAEREQQIGPDAFLLERLADDREALAKDAAGIEPVEEEMARRDAVALRSLAHRHEIHFAGRDVAARPPYVTETRNHPA